MSDAVGVAEDLGWKAGAGTAHGRVYLPNILKTRS